MQDPYPPVRIAGSPNSWLLRFCQNACLPPIGPPVAGFGRYSGVRKLVPGGPFWARSRPLGGPKKSRERDRKKGGSLFLQTLKNQLFKPEGTNKLFQGKSGRRRALSTLGRAARAPPAQAAPPPAAAPTWPSLRPRARGARASTTRWMCGQIPSDFNSGFYENAWGPSLHF